MSYGLHHIHKRKRVSQTRQQKLQPYPHPNKWYRRFDTLLILVAVANPLITLSQIYQIYSSGTSGGTSLAYWVLSTLFAIPWLVYGVIHRDKAHMIAFSLWLILSLVVVIEILMFP